MIAGWAYSAGLQRGKIVGALSVMLPDEKNRGEFRRKEIAARLCEYANNHTELWRERKYVRFWPKTMPGGWPIPPTIPADDESTYWPEVDGWPCPPPALRGQSLGQDSAGQP
jgi:hypothetical protein